MERQPQPSRKSGLEPPAVVRYRASGVGGTLSRSGSKTSGRRCSADNGGNATAPTTPSTPRSSWNPGSDVGGAVRPVARSTSMSSGTLERIHGKTSTSSAGKIPRPTNLQASARSGLEEDIGDMAKKIQKRFQASGGENGEVIPRSKMRLNRWAFLDLTVMQNR